MNTFWENIGHSARIALTTNVYACAYTTHFLPQYYNTVLQMQSKGDQMSPQKKIYVQPNKGTIQRKFGMSNEQEVSERHLSKKIETKK